MKTRNYLYYSILITLFFSSALLQAQNKVNLTQLWKTDVKSFLENSPVLAHLSGGDESQVIVAGREDLIALDGNGNEIWKYRSKGRYMMSPSVWEQKGQPTLLYTADNGGYLRCHNNKGKVLWEAKLKAPCSWSAPAIADLKEDGVTTIVQGDESGSIFAFEALSGKPVWKAAIKGMPSSAAVGDLDGKKGLEIVYLSTKGILTVLHADGTIFWKQNIGGTCQTWGNSAPVIFVASDGQPRIFAASGNGEAFCFSAKGTCLWSRQVKGAVASTLSAGDFDQNGVADLFLITQLGVIYRFTENGELLWNIDMQGRTLGSGSLIDLNRDGGLEYIFCTQDGHLQALDQHGGIVFDYNFDHRTINETPTFGEISKKSSGLEMVLTGGESGLVYCFRSSSPIGAKKQWTTAGGSETKCNYSSCLTSKSQLSMIPMHLNWNELYLGEDICFDVFNPNTTNELISIEASCSHPDGKYQSVTSKLAGHHSQIFLPFSGKSPGNYRFKWSLTSPTGKLLLSGDRAVNLTPFQNEKSLVQSCLKRLRETGTKAQLQRPDLSDALFQEAETIDRQFTVLQPQQEISLAGNQPEQGDIAVKSYQFTKRTLKALKIAELAESSLSLSANTTLIPFEGDLWENKGREDVLPAVASNSIKIARSMVAGENEPISLNLFNLIGRSVTTRIEADSIPGGIKFNLQHSVATMDALGKPAWDALPELDESQTISIPSLSSKEIWITITCASGTKAGHYKIPVIIRALNGAGVQNGPASPQNVSLPIVRADIELDILNFGMAPQGAIRLCAWGSYDKSTIRNLLDHGNTVFIVPQGKSKDNRTDFDFTAQDKIVDELSGNDVFLLLSGLPDVLKEKDLGGSSPELNLYLDKLTAHLASKGIDKKHFAFYPYDEPGGIGWSVIDKLVLFGKMLKAKDPELLVYMDGGGEAPMFKAMQPYLDVWCVGYNELPNKSPVMDIVRNDPGSLLWSYDCSYSYARPMGPNIKSINIVGQFRISALAAFRWNATGIGYWSYNLGDDMWGRTMLEYPLVYKGTGKPINSRRWEAVREGVEDYRILVSLKAKLQKGSNSLTSNAKYKIEQLLKSVANLIDQSDREMKLGMSSKVMDVTNSDEAVRKIRNEMMECVRQLQIKD
ncbi:MAG: PQQ-binding-like beta-propeller repeat protein [Prolixibacteraceae bacterium]|jgi:outer membrane protein assembly factor BamB|nr:PQQ-binding-like beta-propeller repeat protein [Prolixibacteraceae bacterium]